MRPERSVSTRACRLVHDGFLLGDSTYQNRQDFPSTQRGLPTPSAWLHMGQWGHMGFPEQHLKAPSLALSDTGFLEAQLPPPPGRQESLSSGFVARNTKGVFLCRISTVIAAFSLVFQFLICSG